MRDGGGLWLGSVSPGALEVELEMLRVIMNDDLAGGRLLWLQSSRREGRANFCGGAIRLGRDHPHACVWLGSGLRMLLVRSAWGRGQA